MQRYVGNRKMNIADLVRKWITPEIVTQPKDYNIKPYCPYESTTHMIRDCTILHRDCPQTGRYQNCKHYKSKKSRK